MSPPAARSPSAIVPFGRYELVQRIGVGGMGEVWLARLPGPGGISKVCVVKKMLSHLSSDANFVNRFLDEAKVVVHLSHANIAQVFEMGQVGGDYFMAMEYVQGKTVSRISARLREREERFPLPLALWIAARTCDALAYAHRRNDPSGRPLNVVHRDISPSNVIVSYEGDVKVIDFGAAQSTLKQAHTAPRVVIGNLAYMSPEQARKRPVDGRADLYSLAVVLWELIAWQPLPTGGDHGERWRRAAYPKFAPLSEIRPDVPPAVERLVMRGLEKEPDRRPPDADAFREELEGALAECGERPGPASLAALMESLFEKDRAAERALVARALSSPSVPAFDPDATEKSETRRRPTESDQDEVTLPDARKAPKAPPAAAPAATAWPVGRAHEESRAQEPPPPPAPAPPTEDEPTVTWAKPSPAKASRRPAPVTTPAAPRHKERRVPWRLLVFVAAFLGGIALALGAYSAFERLSGASAETEESR